ncbi:MAG: cytochrome C oxidase assembly protein, partial [Alphaproteobacteria bacterium]
MGAQRQMSDPLVEHMGWHLLLMNLVAPALVLAVPALRRSPMSAVLPAATVGQIVLLWTWHAPPVLDAAMRHHALHLAMQLSLF